MTDTAQDEMRVAKPLMGLSRRIKTYFIRGLAVLLPTVLTFGFLAYVYLFIQEKITVYVNYGLVELILWVQQGNGPTRHALEGIFVRGFAGSALGFFMTLVGICIIGALLASVTGRFIWRGAEALIMNTPVLRRVYPTIKQITDFVLTREDAQKLFSKVVAVEYPRKGVWSLGLVTGSGQRQVREKMQGETLSILIPNSPTPLTGYVIMVPREDTIPLDMTIEEAFRFCLSAGVVTPDSHSISAPTLAAVVPTDKKEGVHPAKATNGEEGGR